MSALMIESILAIIFKVRNTGNLIMENLALRQQLAILIGRALSYSGNINLAIKDVSADLGSSFCEGPVAFRTI
jgi:hypothetical protein